MFSSNKKANLGMAKCRKTRFIPVVFLLLCFSCSEPQIPENVIDKESMQRILSDIHLAQSAYETRQQPQDSASSLLLKSYFEILYRHKVTPAHLFVSFDYYMDHPEIMDVMYQNMILELSNREEEFKK